MSGFAAGLQAYAAIARIARDPRDADAEALIRINGTLLAAQHVPFEFSRYAAALRGNREAWLTIRSHIATAAATLPADFVNELTRISHFVDQHTVLALANPDPLRLDILLEINRQLIAGLQAQD